MNSITLKNENVINTVPKYYCNKIYLLLLRFYFIFFPMYPLISKFLGTSLWKDALYIFFTIIGFNVFVKNKFFIYYFSALFLIILFQIVQGYSYMEYITWFLMGPPLFLYFRYISITQYKKDLRILMLIMTLGFLFIFLYEIPMRDSMFFDSEGEKGSQGFFLRDDAVRARFGFVSPMALSQYSWFIAVIVLINAYIKKTVKIIFAALMLLIIFYCSTRAGIFLSVLTLGAYLYTKFGLYKLKINNFITIGILAGIIIFRNFVSGQSASQSNETLSDELRFMLLLDGFDKAKEHFLIGVSGNYFSPRAENWYDFENSWLSLIVCFGLLGIALIILLIKNLVFRINNKYFILLVIPWLAYSAIFPVLQEPTAVFITWYIIAITLNTRKWKLLNNMK